MVRKYATLAIFISSLCLLVLGSLLQVFFGYAHPRQQAAYAWGTDDAYISYRYARNLHEGAGLVYNPGEQPVEGYSNPLYVWLLSLGFYLVSPAQIYFFSVALNLFFLVCSFFLFSYHVREHLGTAVTLVASCLFSLTPSLWVWCASGLETTVVLAGQLGLWSLATWSSRSLLLYQQVLLAVGTVFLVLCRSDGFVWPLLVMLYFYLKGDKGAAYITLVSIVVSYGSLTIWRYYYYGSLLANPVFVKLDLPLVDRLSRSLKQFFHFPLSQGTVLYVFCLLVTSLKGFFTTRNYQTSRSIALLIPGGWLLYWFIIGGDYFGDRFLVVLYPLALYSVLPFLVSRRVSHLLLVLALLIPLCQLPWLYAHGKFDYTVDKYDSWLILGNFLHKKYPGKTLATGAAGKIPYTSQLITLDMLGLNDYHIAHQPAQVNQKTGHNKYDPHYILDNEPDIIVCWIRRNLDLAYGLTRALYQAAGYKVAYVVYMGKVAPEQPIIGVANRSIPEIQQLIYQKYNYAVLKKSSSMF